MLILGPCPPGILIELVRVAEPWRCGRVTTDPGDSNGQAKLRATALGHVTASYLAAPPSRCPRCPGGLRPVLTSQPCFSPPGPWSEVLSNPNFHPIYTRALARPSLPPGEVFEWSCSAGCGADTVCDSCSGHSAGLSAPPSKPNALAYGLSSLAFSYIGGFCFFSSERK